jgi:transposase
MSGASRKQNLGDPTGWVSCTRFGGHCISVFLFKPEGGMRPRRRFSREYTLEAVRLVMERGVSFAQAARDLDLHPNTLRQWVRDQAADPEHAFPGEGQQKPEAAEVTQLRREVAKLRMERDILKKAAAYFAKESM